jgi:hypothetical protein
MVQETCGHTDCNESLENNTAYVSSNGKFCSQNHLMSDANGWRFDDMTVYDVEYKGVGGTCAAPSQEQADRQWRSIHY